MTNRNLVTSRVTVGPETRIGVEFPGDATGELVARIAVIDVATPNPSQRQISELEMMLASASLISVGIARGRVSNDAAKILLACDFIVSAPDCVWDEASSAILAAASRRLPEPLIGSVAVLVSPITPTDLFKIGLITEVADDVTKTAELLAADLSSISSGSLVGTKEMIDTALVTDLASALALESALQVARLMSEEHHQIVEAKRVFKSSGESSSPSQT